MPAAAEAKTGKDGYDDNGMIDLSAMMAPDEMAAADTPGNE